VGHAKLTIQASGMHATQALQAEVTTEHRPPPTVVCGP